jgi:hypothetical protein
MAGHRGLDVTGWSRRQQAAEVHLGLMLINNLRQIRVIGKIFWTRDCGPRDVCGESGDYLSNHAGRAQKHEMSEGWPRIEHRN